MAGVRQAAPTVQSHPLWPQNYDVAYSLCPPPPCGGSWPSPQNIAPAALRFARFALPKTSHGAIAARRRTTGHFLSKDKYVTVQPTSISFFTQLADVAVPAVRKGGPLVIFFGGGGKANKRFRMGEIAQLWLSQPGRCLRIWDPHPGEGLCSLGVPPSLGRGSKPMNAKVSSN